MQTSRSRLLAISAATLALIVAGSASVAAHPGNRDDGYGMGQGRTWGPGLGSDVRGDAWGAYGARLGMAFEGLIRRETIYETADGLVTQRMDNGTVSSIAESALEYSLANGETASVSTDADTQVISFGEQTVQVGRRGLSRTRMVPQTIELADVSAGSQVVVWAQSQDDGTFLAQRIVVQPLTDDTDAAEESEPEAEVTPDTAAGADA
jgi:hypothetical protein